MKRDSLKTAILTDTNSRIMVGEGGVKDIYVIAMPVVIDENCYFEGVDITSGQLYVALKNGRERFYKENLLKFMERKIVFGRENLYNRYRLITERQ